jgi:MFS family permease
VESYIDQDLGKKTKSSEGNRYTIELIQMLGPRSYHYWIVPAGRLPNVISWLIAGSLSDRYGRRNILVVGNVIALIGAIVCASTSSIYVVIIGQIISGLGCGCQNQAVAIMSELFQKRFRSIVQGKLKSSILLNRA